MHSHFLKIYLILISALFTLKTVSANPVCKSHLNGKVVWNKSGDKKWKEPYISQLCNGSSRLDAIKCFNKVWKQPGQDWRSAIKICGGARNKKRSKLYKNKRTQNTKLVNRKHIKANLRDSIVTSYNMSLLSNLVYRIEGRSVGTDVKKGLSRLGVHLCRNGVMVNKKIFVSDNIAMILSDGTNVYVVFRGTKTFGDVVTDLKHYVLPKTFKGNSGYVHKGFYDTFFGYKDLGIFNVIQDCLNGGHIYVTGHSLGGALANLLSIELISNHQRLGGVYTFGSPRVGGKSWVNAFKRLVGSKSYQWVNSRDPVPMIPKGSLKQEFVGIDQRLKSIIAGRVYAPLPNKVLETSSRWEVTKENLNLLDGKGTLTYHSKKKYSYDLWSLHKARLQKVQEAPSSFLYDGECTSSIECRANEKCSTVFERKCVPKDQCTKDSQCPKSKFCKRTGTNKCVNLLANGQSCLKSRHCKSGRCFLFKCKR